MNHQMGREVVGENQPNRGGKNNKHQPHRPCPRCGSDNTTFSYFNNRSLDQLRYYCKGCMRHWTHGGTLRNIPVGSGKRSRSKRPRKASTSQQPPLVAPMTTIPAGPQVAGENYDLGLPFKPYSNQPFDPIMELFKESNFPPNFEPHPTDPLFQRMYSSYEREIRGPSSSEAKPDDASAPAETKNTNNGDDKDKKNDE